MGGGRGVTRGWGVRRQKHEGAELRRAAREAREALRAVMAQAGDDAEALMGRLRSA